MLLAKPSHIIVLDVDPEVAQERMKTDPGRAECYEVLETQKRVSQRYFELVLDSDFWDIWPKSNPPLSIVIPGGLSKNDVQEKLIEFLGV